MRAVLLSGFTLILLAASALPALADEGIDWTATTPEAGVVVDNEVFIDGAGTHRLVTIGAPEIGGESYAATGSVRYENVSGTGYLEMWSYFADGGAFYSRTLAEDGPMAALVGTSADRPFEVPFQLNGSEGPERVEINVVLPEGGAVWIGPLELTGFGPSTDWWTERQSAFIGATLGILAGLSGAALGILSGRRKSRRLVEGIMIGGLSIGGVLLATGVAALVNGQPRHVWYPVILVGTILAVINALLIPATRRNHTAAELHRMKALDA